MKIKRDATKDEEEVALSANHILYNRSNPDHTVSLEKWQEKLLKAKEEGYKTEICDCGCIFMAFHHFTTCRDKRCPFSDGVSLLERLEQNDNLVL